MLELTGKKYKDYERGVIKENYCKIKAVFRVKAEIITVAYKIF